MLKTLLRPIYYSIVGLGIFPFYNFRVIKNYCQFQFDKKQYKNLLSNLDPDSRDGSITRITAAIPRLNDKFSPAGTFDDEYFFQDIWVAKQILLEGPSLHFDVGSSISSFIAHLLASSQPVLVGDIRQLPINIDENLNSIFFDLQSSDPRPFKTFTSVSCLHTLEHVGLGRYGDKIDPLGSVKALQLITKYVDFGGFIYLSLPISSTPRVNFNSERLFSVSYIKVLFDKLNLSIYNGLLFRADNQRLYFSTFAELIESTSEYFDYALAVFKLTKNYCE